MFLRYQGSDEIKSFEDAVKASKKLIPLMIKASAGGGGKGMRIVYEEKELNDKFTSAKMKLKRALVIQEYLSKSL